MELRCFFPVWEKVVPRPIKLKYPVNPAAIGEHLRKRRMDLGLYQKDVAARIKVSEDCITFWENHRCQPQVKHVPKIIAFLGYNPYLDLKWDSFADKVRTCRRLLGFSFRKMAKVLNADPGTIAKWENGKTVPHEPRRGELTTLLQLKIDTAKTSGEADPGSAGAQPRKE